MAVFEGAVLTTKGNELLIDAVAGNEITFTKMSVGSGVYTDEERERYALEKMESLKDVRQEFTFSACRKASEQCYMLTAVISNRELTSSYKITEIGIYGKKSGDEEDFLCSISVTKSMEESDTLPVYNGLQECQIVQDYYITISPDAEVTIVTKGASVLIEDFLAKIEELKKEFADKIEASKQSFRDGVDKIYNFLKGLGFTPADKSPDEICVSIKNIYDTRYTNGYNAGRTQGHEDVKANPGAYGVSTLPKTYALVAGYEWTYTCPAAGEYTVCVDVMANNSHTNNALGNKVTLKFGGEWITVYDHHLKSAQPEVWETVGTKVGNRYTRSLAAGTVIAMEVSPSYHEDAGDYGDSSITYVDTAALIVIG